MTTSDLARHQIQRAKCTVERAKKARALNTDEYEDECRKAKASLTQAQREQLAQFVREGPVWDGDVMNKVARDQLRAIGDLVVSCVVKGEQGYTAATYLGQAISQAATIH